MEPNHQRMEPNLHRMEHSLPRMVLSHLRMAQSPLRTALNLHRMVPNLLLQTKQWILTRTAQWYLRMVLMNQTLIIEADPNGSNQTVKTTLMIPKLKILLGSNLGEKMETTSQITIMEQIPPSLKTRLTTLTLMEPMEHKTMSLLINKEVTTRTIRQTLPISPCHLTTPMRPLQLKTRLNKEMELIGDLMATSRIRKLNSRSLEC
mmetsp:Transcript_9399/g.7175  ORF Transcript_9399/g.7175 Transcript_9399/m.7175 type:complete len:205 (+) Transcript_9399:176-790(+)